MEILFRNFELEISKQKKSKHDLLFLLFIIRIVLFQKDMSIPALAYDIVDSRK